MIGESNNQLQHLRPRDRHREAGLAALPQGLEQLLPARECRLGRERRRQDGPARGLGPLLRRLLAGLLRGPAPVQHLQPRAGLQRPRLQLLRRSTRSPRGPRSSRPTRSAPPCRPSTASPTCGPWTRSSRRRPSRTTARTCSGSSGGTRRSRSATWARWAGTSSATATSTSSIPRPATRPYPDYEYINQFESTATSHYNALQASLKVRGWHGLTSTINYTCSKSIDNASDGQDYVPQRRPARRQPLPGREKALLELRQPPPPDVVLHLGDRLARRAPGCTSGWALNGVVTVASGMPFNLELLRATTTAPASTSAGPTSSATPTPAPAGPTGS